MSIDSNQHPTLTGAEILWASLAGEGTITFDIPARTLTLNVPGEEIAARLATFVDPAPRYKRGIFFKYANSVSSASHGAVAT